MIKVEKKKHSKLDAKVLFNLVSNVESYSKFIPWVKNSTIEREVHDYFFAKLEMKYLLFSGSFVSKVSLDKYDNKINVLGVKGPFNYLEANWIFDEYDNGTLISISLELDLENSVLESLIKKESEKLINKAVLSFEKRIFDISNI